MFLHVVDEACMTLPFLLSFLDEHQPTSGF